LDVHINVLNNSFTSYKRY